MDQIAALMPLIILIFIMYFLLIRPQRKREKAINAMRNALKVGDEVITIGGIRGRIIRIKDEVLTIQVGADKIKFDVMRWAISSVNGKDSAPSPSKKVGKEESAEEDSKPAPKKLPKRMKRADAAPPDETKTAKTAEVTKESPADTKTDETEKATVQEDSQK
ncbi:MAG: preprotein translocase subunit YajC [Anaerovoracaceae bacterium]|nr:preprotein translocase subunit YajC [Clostridiales bacterium]